MKKLSFWDFANYLETINNSYYDFIRFSISRNGKRYYAWKYVLSKELTDTQRDYLKQFPNVSTGSAVYKYAPEIKDETVNIFDNKLTTVFK